MPSQTRRLSSRERSAAKKIQTKFRNKKTKMQQRTNASRKIQSRVRGKQTRTKLINNNCSICFEPMIHNVSITSPCGHKFHSHCIRRSLTATRGTCPLCRTVVTNIPYPSTSGQQIQPPPPPPPVQPNILDPIQRRQHILNRLREIQMLERAIIQQRPQLPWPPEIPNITYEEALSNLIRARQIVEQARILLHEASENYQNYRNLRINGNPVDQDVTNMYYITSDLLTRARENRNNADRIADDLEFRPLNTLI
jgi:hypothetical protein